MGLIDSTVNTPICPKCGSNVQIRQRKANSGEYVTILQCLVCKHYRILSSEQ